MGVLILGVFLACGMLITRRIFAEHAPWVRWWLGLSCGLLGMMWLVVPPAFFFGFTLISHALAAGVMILLTATTVHFFPAPTERSATLSTLSRQEIGMVSFITALICLLLYTHILYPNSQGGLSVGQSTFGDLSLHLGIITSVAEQGAFPPEYSIFPGHRLSYPFLVNTLSSSLYLLGTPLRWSVLVPSFFLAFCLVIGFAILARDILQQRAAVLWSLILFFFNGGFGFSYFLEGLKNNPENFTRIFHEFYKTPTNLNEENIRWSNVICDMLVPQRTTLAGWCFLIVCLWFLYQGIVRGQRKYFVATGIGAGLLPMIHTHSFLGLGIISGTWFFAFLASQDSGHRKGYLLNWLWYGSIVAVLATPQLLFWTFRQASEGQFLKFHFDWANHGDIWLWFWVKNVGLVFIFLLPALCSSNRKLLSLYAGAISIFVIADLVLFQPNDYDNNKLFYIWYMLSCMVVAGFLYRLHQRLEGLQGRWLINVLVLFVATFSATLTLGREIVSDYQLFDRHQVTAAEFIRTHTPRDALFITADNHNNPVTSLTGRNIFVGTAIFLFFHGIDYQSRWNELESMFTKPEAFVDLTKKYGVDYVYFSSYERDKFKVDDTYFTSHLPLVFESGDVKIYAVSARALKALTADN